MGSSDYTWAPGEEPPLIKDHSLAKHEVLGRYLRTYVDVLTTNPVIDNFRLTLVDGFAGGGTYKTTRGTLHHGSPLQMVHAMNEAEAIARSKRKKDFLLNVEFFFVEKSKRNREVLSATVDLDPIATRYAAEHRLHLLSGTFEQSAPRVIEHIESRGRARRAIFLLDQYGYSKVPFAILQTIFARLPNAEVLLTFATDWLIDYMSEKGVISPARLARMGLRDMADQFEQLLLNKEHRNPRWRRLVQSVLHDDLVEQSGAKYFTPFFIVSPQAHREYWFVHLSGHSKARDEMAKLHWALENRFAHYGRNGLGMLGYDPREDVFLSRQEVLDFSTESSQALIVRLADEIPARLHGCAGEGISFSDFFDQICNQTPATSEQLRDVLRELSVEKEIEIVRAKDGKPRRVGVQIKPSDRIRMARQLFLLR